MSRNEDRFWELVKMNGTDSKAFVEYVLKLEQDRDELLEVLDSSRRQSHARMRRVTED